MSERKKKRSTPPEAGKRGPHKHDARGVGRWRRIAPLLLVMLSVSLAIAAALSAKAGWGLSSEPREPRAAIVDQLALTEPNPAFAEAATSTLEQAGYAVDYYPGEQVTVELYRQLPTHHYDLLVLRAHSGRFRTLDGNLTDLVSIFTNEPYDGTEYYPERAAGFVARARYFETDPPSYFFAIRERFVELDMKGKFDGATVIIMGCDGLRSNVMAKAFVSRGATAVIGWNTLVSAARTDEATERLLRHLVTDRLDVQQAVASTMREVGPDPENGSVLQVYPPEAAASTMR